MPDAAPVTRESIIESLATALEPLPYIDAMWEGGAAAFDRLDAWSDVDLYVIAADDRVPDTFRAIEAALTRLSPIRQKHEPSWPPEAGIEQAFYRLERASEYLLVDLAVLKRSAPDKFLEPELHGQARFAFNKAGIGLPRLAIDPFVAKLLERRDRLVRRIEMFGAFVPKEIHRRNWLGALEAYQKIVLDSLVQVLRMAHEPAHYAFSVRYAVYELPPEDVRRLEDLFYVRTPEELPGKFRQATDWFREAASVVTEDQVRSRLAAAEVGAT